MDRIGIICALYFEASALAAGNPPAQQPVKLNGQTLLIVSGMGRERAKRAAHRLLGENADRLVSFGSAGALSPALKPGDLVIPEEVRGTGRSYTAHAVLPAPAIGRLSGKNITMHTGPLACAAEPVVSKAAKQALLAQTGAIAVDMESAGILDAAEQADVPVSVLRVITDSAEMALPAAILRRIDDFGRINVPGLGLDLVTAPAQVPAAIRLGCASRRAHRTMKLAAHELLAQGRNRNLSKQSK